MRFCSDCGAELTAGASFCSTCGKPVAAPVPTPVAPVPTPAAPANDTLIEEQEFLDVTHRLLRWERKAWSISGKVLLAIGIAFAAIFSILAFAFAMDAGGAFSVMFLFYAMIYGGLIIAFGVISKKAADKIPFYLDNLYSDFGYAYDRCGSVGMLVFTALFGIVSPVFFIINFVRMKANRTLIEKIIARQKSF